MESGLETQVETREVIVRAADRNQKGSMQDQKGSVP